MKYVDTITIWSFNILFLGLLVYSVLGIILIHCTLYTYPFSISLLGLNSYLNSFNEFSTLFITTSTVLTAKFTLMQWRASVEAIKDKIKEDRFKEWCYVLDRAIKHIEKNGSDINLVEIFLNRRRELFNVLYKTNMLIRDIDELNEALNIFETSVNIFEKTNLDYIKNLGVYSKSNFAYSGKAFEILIHSCIDKNYDDFFKDLNIWYLKQLQKI